MTTQQALTDQQIDDIEARADAATPGPWGTYTFGGDTLIEVAADLGDTGTGYRARRTICRFDEEPMDNDPAHRDWDAEQDWQQVQADAEFAAHAPEDVSALLAEVRRQRARIAELEGPAVEARAALATLCYDLEDPGSNALGALYLISQATVGVEAPKDDATAALARLEAAVIRRCAEFVRDTYSGDETADAADTLDRDATIHERGCPTPAGDLDNCQRCGILGDRHPVPVRSGYGLAAAASAVVSAGAEDER